MKEHSIRLVIPVEQWISIEGPIMIRHQPANRSPLPHDCSHLLHTELRPLQLKARLIETEPELDWTAILA
jgi:hypothetical protein